MEWGGRWRHADEVPWRGKPEDTSFTTGVRSPTIIITSGQARNKQAHLFIIRYRRIDAYKHVMSKTRSLDPADLDIDRGPLVRACSKRIPPVNLPSSNLVHPPPTLTDLSTSYLNPLLAVTDLRVKLLAGSYCLCIVLNHGVTLIPSGHGGWHWTCRLLLLQVRYVGSPSVIRGLGMRRPQLLWCFSLLWVRS